MSAHMMKMEMTYEQNPKDGLLSKLDKAYERVDLFGAKVLVATFRRDLYAQDAKTKGGIIVPEKVIKEDIYQGRVGLVLKLGPLAFVEGHDGITFSGKSVKFGDWVFYRPQDGIGTSLNGIHCRILDDDSITGTIDNPELVM